MSTSTQTEILELRSETPADRVHLREVLDDLHRVEQMAALRTVLIGLMAFLSGPLWLAVLIPGVFGSWTLLFSAAWLPAALLFGVASLADRGSVRRLRVIADRPTDNVLGLQSATCAAAVTDP